VQLGVFVVHGFAASAVGTARRKHHETTSSSGLTEFGEANSSEMVDVVSELRIEIAEWVVGKCGEMNDSVESLQVFLDKIAKIFAESWNFHGGRAEVAAFEKVGVETHNMVTGSLDEGSRDGADIALVSGEKNFHVLPSLL
jgi:hypothetical protein